MFLSGAVLYVVLLLSIDIPLYPLARKLASWFSGRTVLSVCDNQGQEEEEDCQLANYLSQEE